MTTVSKVTPESAPRDPEGLAKLGIFQLRVLIEALGALKNEQEKMAFAKMQAPQKVELAHQLLAQWDKAHGAGGPTNGVAPMTGVAPTMPTPAMMPPQSMPVTQVDPAAVAAAAQAAVPQVQAPVTRQPRTSSKEAAPDVNLGADVVNLLNRIVQQNDEANSTLAAGIKDILNQVSETAKANQTHAANYKAVFGALSTITATLQTVAMQSKLAMALVLPLAEQVLGASREDILNATLGDLETVQAIVQQATQSGKG